MLLEVNRVNKAFESNSADPTKLLEELMNLLHALVSKVTTPNSKFNFLSDRLEDFIDKNCYLGTLENNASGDKVLSDSQEVESEDDILQDFQEIELNSTMENNQLENQDKIIHD
ncbi:hypothetical protein FQR65_LT04349 [Abscondita terminalis]|nr:hypothetical protein FQR65_LT04349 [Abscondita terminalis]